MIVWFYSIWRNSSSHFPNKQGRREADYRSCKNRKEKIFLTSLYPSTVYSVCSVAPNSAAQWTVACQVPLPMEFSRQEPGVVCHFLLQGIFLTQGSNPHLLCLLHWQVDSLQLAPMGIPFVLELYVLVRRHAALPPHTWQARKGPYVWPWHYAIAAFGGPPSAAVTFLFGFTG